MNFLITRKKDIALKQVVSLKELWEMKPRCVETREIPRLWQWSVHRCWCLNLGKSGIGDGKKGSRFWKDLAVRDNLVWWVLRVGGLMNGGTIHWDENSGKKQPKGWRGVQFGYVVFVMWVKIDSGHLSA